MTAVAEAGWQARTSGQLPPPEERGVTRIPDRVVERITARAAGEVDLASGLTRRGVRRQLSRAGGRAAPTVSVQVDGQLAIVRLGLAVTYPAPARQVARQVREHVTARVGEMTGLRVRQVDIEVTGLARPSSRIALTTVTSTDSGQAGPAGLLSAAPAGDRAARRAFRPQRTLPAVTVAAVLAAGAILTAIQVIAARTGHTVQVLPVAWLDHTGRDQRWDGAGPVAVAAAVTALGLVLIWRAVSAGRSAMIRLAAGPGTMTAISRRSLRRSLEAAAIALEGVTGARVRPGRHRVHVQARTALRDAPELQEAVRQAVTLRCQALGLAGPLAIRVTVTRSEDSP